MVDVSPADKFAWGKRVLRLKLPDKVKLLAWALQAYAKTDGSDVYPGDARLADETGFSLRSVKRYRTVLIEMGLLTLVRRGGGRGNASPSVYQLTLPVPHLASVPAPPAPRKPVDNVPVDSGLRCQKRGIEVPTPRGNTLGIVEQGNQDLDLPRVVAIGPAAAPPARCANHPWTRIGAGRGACAHCRAERASSRRVAS